MSIQRKEFLLALAGGALLGACGGGGSDDAAPGAGCGATIQSNHGHALTVPAADLDSTTARTYGIAGVAGHDHVVTLSAAELAALKAGQSVSVTSTGGPGHEHGVTIRCV
jgi:hypothetical protein